MVEREGQTLRGAKKARCSGSRRTCKKMGGIVRVKRKKGENPAASHGGGERGGQRVSWGRRIFKQQHNVVCVSVCVRLPERS